MASSKPESSFQKLDDRLDAAFGQSEEFREYFKEPRDFRALQRMMPILRALQLSSSADTDMTSSLEKNPNYNKLLFVDQNS